MVLRARVKLLVAAAWTESAFPTAKDPVAMFGVPCRAGTGCHAVGHQDTLTELIAGGVAQPAAYFRPV
jgi:hypothetical protein